MEIAVYFLLGLWTLTFAGFMYFHWAYQDLIIRHRKFVEMFQMMISQRLEAAQKVQEMLDQQLNYYYTGQMVKPSNVRHLKLVKNDQEMDK